MKRYAYQKVFKDCISQESSLIWRSAYQMKGVCLALEKVDELNDGLISKYCIFSLIKVMNYYIVALIMHAPCSEAVPLLPFLMV